MAYHDRKHVSFDEPLLVEVIEINSEKFELPENEGRSRNRKFVLLIIAALFIGLLVTGPPLRHCAHHMQKHVRHKYVHRVTPAEHDPMANVKASIPKIDQKSPVHTQSVKRADNGSLCSSSQCTNFATSIKSNLAANYMAIDPCEDFSTYVCGGWREKHDYRADQASVDTASIMEDVNKDLLHEILEGEYVGNSSLSAANKTIDKQNFQKMKTAYTSCMDQDAIKAVGVKPLRDLLDELENYFPATSAPNAQISGNEELTKALRWLSKNSVKAVVSASVTADDKSPDVNIVAISSGEVGLPSKKYYDNKNTVANYTRALAQMFQIVWTGVPITSDNLWKDPEKYMDTAKQIIEFDAKLAKASPDLEVASEVAYYYNPTTSAEVDKLVPEISISKFIDAQKPAGYVPKSILNTDPLFFGNLSTILKATPRNVLHAYFQSKLISTWGGRLHKDYRLPSRAFSNMLAGRDPLAEGERWRTCVSEIDSGLGWLLSASFVERAFSQDAKALGDRIISDIKAEFTRRLKGLEWMSPATQALATKKVKNIIQKIGYPTASPDIMDPADLQKYYSNVTITNSYWSNGRVINSWTLQKSWNDLLKPVDRARWVMTSPTANAYYNPSGNEIVFPAGIMQLPVFGDQLPEYVSYGAFGSIAGHELTHGFDNNGAHYDENGKYADWWDNATLTNFNKKTQCFVKQFNKFTVPGLDGQPLHVNGKLTLGENIADAGGMLASYAAWQRRNAAKPDRHILGLEQFTKEQMFFVSYSNWWCGKVRSAQAVNYIYTDPHSPTDKRIIGTLANSEGFREAFKCKSKEPTCELW